jgi:hypothetical protein
MSIATAGAFALDMSRLDIAALAPDGQVQQRF